MRTSRYGLWVRLRELLNERELIPADTVLVHLFPDGGDSEFGTVVSDGGRVYSFDLRYNRESMRSARAAAMERWLDVTDRWQQEPVSSEIADAFIWKPPPRRTRLTERRQRGLHTRKVILGRDGQGRTRRHGLPVRRGQRNVGVGLVEGSKAPWP